jgi:hypothetical protein
VESFHTSHRLTFIARSTLHLTYAPPSAPPTHRASSGTPFGRCFGRIGPGGPNNTQATKINEHMPMKMLMLIRVKGPIFLIAGLFYRFIPECSAIRKWFCQTLPTRGIHEMGSPRFLLARSRNGCETSQYSMRLISLSVRSHRCGSYTTFWSVFV